MECRIPLESVEYQESMESMEYHESVESVESFVVQSFCIYGKNNEDDKNS